METAGPMRQTIFVADTVDCVLLFSIMADKITRIAIVDDNRCKPKRCAQECKKVRLASPSSASGS
jgi:hypothetical protein